MKRGPAAPALPSTYDFHDSFAILISAMSKREALTPVFQQNEILFGRDSTPGLIAFEPEGGDKVRAYRRADGKLETELFSFRPFILMQGDGGLRGWRGEAELQKLEGTGFFDCLALFSDLEQLGRARTHLQNNSGKAPSAADPPYWYISDPLHQYLLLSGQTHFLGMTFGDLRRLQIAVETYCQDGFEFADGSRASDRITAIALCDSTGWEQVISGRALGEPEMLAELVKQIEERDPDVIEGHNLFRSDLEYIERRARRHKVPLKLGRDGSVLRGHASRMQLAERTITYRRYDIHGRHIVDTWILAQHYDIATRELASFELQDVARHLGIAGKDRTYVPATAVSRYFERDPDALFRYVLDNARETRALAEILSASYFVQAQIFPYSYQNVALRGNATKIDALFLREYLHRCHSIPQPDEGREVIGGFTDMEYQGVAQRVLHCDVTSLYPSIMLAYGYLPEKDELEVLPGLLRDLRAFRVKAKELARNSQNEEARLYFSALQATFKILINSFYGYLGFPMGHFNDFDAANRVTAKGRELIQSIIVWLKETGAKILEVDTDGIYFIPAGTVETLADEDQLIDDLGKILPKGIQLELDGRYPAMFSYKIKNYALLDEKGRLIIKGSGLRSRGLELFQREWLEEMLRFLLQREPEKIPPLYQRYLDDIEHHRRGISWLAKTESLQDSLDSYRTKVKAKKRNAAAPYELALQSERPYQPGDQISYYVTGTKSKVKISEHCKLVSRWDGRNPDENVEHYKTKLRELYEKFRPFFEEDKNQQSKRSIQESVADSPLPLLDSDS
jgi:DNA polymerase elongation subunit (family B)